MTENIISNEDNDLQVLNMPIYIDDNMFESALRRVIQQHAEGEAGSKED